MRKIFSKACARAIQDSTRGVDEAFRSQRICIPTGRRRSDLAGARAAAFATASGRPASPPSTSPQPGAKAMAERLREVRASLHQAILAVCFATPVT